ncbi:hypothetical protein HanHA300_Chr00c0303g0741821 [Helianthus annuus]|nr:hypothetical protein HanHA89_Chr15g0631571 [Helianthus annuus]KAJ0630358.1 hypothetical protein HanHA300_Chr00c0303g0741821 [Helianthus annuus]KAJ0650158.1 hypothetical protein HanLR1_Chr15g0592491 [Helianthus annuus]KAJ0653930.1 hypothetical protein HanOQP8_Chr15g0589141 [Helianthus annuus]
MSSLKTSDMLTGQSRMWFATFCPITCVSAIGEMTAVTLRGGGGAAEMLPYRVCRRRWRRSLLVPLGFESFKRL